MAKISRWIPFNMLPGSTGLKGKTRERASAEYYFTGEDLDRELVRIDFEDNLELFRFKNLDLDLKYNHITEYEYKIKKLDLSQPKDTEEKKREKTKLDLEYEKITEYDYEKSEAEYVRDADDRAVRLVEIEYEYQLIDENQRDKQIANIRKQPWVTIINSGLDAGKGPSGFYIEYDWNDYWIEELRQAGMKGNNDTEIMLYWQNWVSLNEALGNADEEINPLTGGLGARYGG